MQTLALEAHNYPIKTLTHYNMISKSHISSFCLCCLFLFLALAPSITQPLLAQKTQVYETDFERFNLAMLWFEEGNYLLAQKQFDEYLRAGEHSFADESRIRESKARYYKALCALKLDNPDAEYLIVDFLDKESEENYFTNMSYYYLGNFYFNKRKFRDVIACYANVNPNHLTVDESGAFYFQYAYSYFTSKKFKESKAMFSKITSVYNEYYFPSNYYYGIINFFDEDYNAALTSFQRIEKNKDYEKSIPYYITLIYYNQKAYDKLLSYAGPKAKQNGIKNQKELNQLVGQTYFNRQQFTEALPYLEYYVEQSKKVRKEDIFQLGFTQYQMGRYENAIQNFSQLNTLQDSIGQNAMYHLADCYLETDEKAAARNAFDAASKMQHDEVIQEVSAFNFAKLSYELGFSSEAINAFQQFINDYPNSKHNNEARSLLSNIFETTQNYRDALGMLENMPDKSPQLQQTYQRVLYYRAIEMYNDQRYKEAVTLMDRAIAAASDPKINALGYFWKGDIAYKAKNYDAAFTNMQQFLEVSGNRAASAKAIPAAANYTMGYCQFKQRNYQAAKQYFDTAVGQLSSDPSASSNSSTAGKIYPDAILRSGDCNFMQREYAAASKSYDKIIQANSRGADYAYYQKGILSGLMGKYPQKVSNLQKLISNYPKSYYADDALYQLALTHVALEDYQAAIKTHKDLINKHKDSEYVRKSLVNMGLIYFNLQDYDRALENYGAVLKNFPKSSEAKEAVDGVREVYLAKGDADGFLAYMKKFKGVDVTVNAKDSLSYQIAEKYYTQGDCDNAIREFNKYLMNFKNGSFALYAHYYRGQCLYSKEAYLKARKDYDYIVEQPANLFTEQALDKGGRIALYVDKNYPKSYDYFKRLYETASRKDLIAEALRGLVRSSYHLDKEMDLDQYGNELLKNENMGSQDIMETYYYTGILAYRKGRFDKAQTNFQQVANRTTNEKGAQSRYYLAEIYYKQGRLEDCKNMCFRVKDETASQMFWVVKSYILLSDYYVAKTNYFQAKATLKSVIENYTPEDDLKKEAREKLAAVTKLEAAQTKLKKDPQPDDYLEMEEE